MIKPTVGRVVNFYPSIYNSGGHPDIVRNEGGQPFAATVAYVWNDRLVNLAFVDHNGIPFNAASVQLLQDDDERPPTGFYAEWMDYQKGQAAKTERVEAMLKGHTGGTLGGSGGNGTPPALGALAATETECAANAVAPRVSLSDIEAAIVRRIDFNGEEMALLFDRETPARGPLRDDIASLKLLSICILVMRNGFTIIGKSAPASAANFNAELGRKLAYEDAVRQIWPLMGFALRDRLAAAEGRAKL